MDNSFSDARAYLSAVLELSLPLNEAVQRLLLLNITFSGLCVSPSDALVADCSAIADDVMECFDSGAGGFTPYPTRGGKEVLPSLPMTHSGLSILAACHALDRIAAHRRAIASFVASCWDPQRGFCELVGAGESDARHSLCAVASLALLFGRDGATRALEEVGVAPAAVIRKVLACQCRDGGFSMPLSSEGHGAITYCAVSTLHLLDAWHDGDASWKRKCVRFCVGRLVRVGNDAVGLCGRPGKDADTCYTFWIGAALKILGGAADVKRARPNVSNFIHACAHVHGGIAKHIGIRCDPVHTGLSLIALAVLGDPHFNPADAALCLPSSCVPTIVATFADS